MPMSMQGMNHDPSRGCLSCVSTFCEVEIRKVISTTLPHFEFALNHVSEWQVA